MLDASTAFFARHDLLLCPTVICPPFDAATPWPREVGGHTFANYVGWMKACSLLSALDVPAVSVPCGVTSTGLPVGLQIVGPPGCDAAVLAEAAAYEAAHAHASCVPRDPLVAGV
jgi:amidase